MPQQRKSPGSTAQTGRHRARRNAMMVLYKLDLMAGDVDAAITDWSGEHGFDLPPYARTLVEGVTAHRDELDATIGEHLHEWSVERLGAIERTILRIATWEMRHGDVPAEVAIDEAIELAKRYATPQAGKLVNGTLGAYVRKGGHGRGR